MDYLRFFAGSDDGHEELQAAVNSAVNFGKILFLHSLLGCILNFCFSIEMSCH